MAALSIAVLDITLQDVNPAVRRRLGVPSSIRLSRLHLVLQAAMGWSASHLWAFHAGGASWGPSDEDNGDSLDAAATTLREMLADTGVRQFRYLYDFGDGWVHRVRLLRFEERIPGLAYPCLFDAQGRCPPEDVGGPPGYAELLAARQHADGPAAAALRQQFSLSFDPNDPQYTRLEAAIARLARRAPLRKRPGRG